MNVKNIIFSVLITNRPSAPSSVSTMKIQSTTEKYDEITRLFWNFSKDGAIESQFSRKNNKKLFIGTLITGKVLTFVQLA